jgi:putative DNA primase/helicase
VTDTDRTALLTAAIRWAQAGASVLPVKTDGSKAPGGGDWKERQATRAPLSQLGSWFDIVAKTTDGLGLVTGEVSGFLEMLEAEGPAVTDGYLDRLAVLCEDNGIGEVWATLCSGYTERSGGGGLHLLFRTEGPSRPNTKLASRPDPTDLLPSGRPKVKVMMETRGEGGFVVVAPSAGRTRVDGGAWEAIGASAPDTVPTITCEQRDHLYAVITMLDETPAKTDPTPRPPRTDGVISGLRPGDDFNVRADWLDDLLLGGAGWRRMYRVGPGWGWQRPGKDTPGLSATTGQSGDGALDRLYVFSSSTEFPTEEPLSKFWVYAELHHGGDLAAAASALAALGYGEPGHRTSTFDPADPFGAPPPQRPAQPTPDHVPDDFGPSIGDPVTTVTALDATQLSAAIALLNEYGHVMRWNTDAERWLVWDGALWREQPPDGGLAYWYAIQTSRSMPENGRDAIKAKRSAQTASGLSATLRVAQSFPYVRVTTDDLDSHPWELSTPDGIVDLRTGALMDPDPARMHTKVTHCSPDWEADRSLWLDYLDTTFQGDAATILYVQRLLGYACVGEVREHVLAVLHGSGQNGKSVLLDTLLGIMKDYGVTMPSRFLVQGGEQTSDKAKLIGKRVAVAIETNEGEKFNEALAKEITGGDRLTGRLLYRNYVEWRPSHTMLFATNHRLEVPSGGTSFWRRMREIPFSHEVATEDRDDALALRLWSEHGSAVLSWIVDGAVDYAQHGLPEPPAVLAATRDYETSTDTIGRFVAEEVILGVEDEVRVRTADVYSRYEAFCRESGDHPIPKRAFSISMQKRFAVTYVKSHGIRYYGGMMLSSVESDPFGSS